MSYPLRFCALLVAIPFVAHGCGDDAEPLPSAWKGQHVEIRTDLDLGAWCPGTLPRLDRQVGVLKDLFEVPDEYLVTYYLYPPSSSDYPCDAHACSNQDAVFTVDLPDPHEIVHAVSSAHGDMPNFFEEGAASYWGASQYADFQGLDIREVLDASWSTRMTSPREYALAAHFTSYLVHTHGLAPYITLLQSTTEDQTREAFEAAFELSLGLTLDEALDAYLEQQPYCTVESARTWPLACSQPGVTLATGEWTLLDLDISCDDPEVIGPTRAEFGWVSAPRIFREITIESERVSNRVVMDFPGPEASDGVEVELKRCDTDCDKVMFNWQRIQPGIENVWLIPPGRYVLRVSRPADDPGPVRLRWHPDP